MKLTLYRHHGKNERFKDLWRNRIPFHELIICLQGDVIYNINGEKVRLQDKDMLYVPMGAIRSRKGTKEQVDYISIHFLTDDPPALPVKIPQGVCSCVSALIMSADQIWHEFFPNAEPMIEKIVECILKYTQSRLEGEQVSPLVQDLMRFMLKNLSSKLKVEDIASQVLLSSSYCNAVFKKEMGMPLMQYLMKIRLEEAKLQLLANEYTLKEISENVGFDDYNLFARAFKKHLGITPLEYRNLFVL